MGVFPIVYIPFTRDQIAQLSKYQHFAAVIMGKRKAHEEPTSSPPKRQHRRSARAETSKKSPSSDEEFLPPITLAKGKKTPEKKKSVTFGQEPPTPMPATPKTLKKYNISEETVKAINKIGGKGFKSILKLVLEVCRIAAESGKFKMPQDENSGTFLAKVALAVVIKFNLVVTYV